MNPVRDYLPECHKFTFCLLIPSNAHIYSVDKQASFWSKEFAERTSRSRTGSSESAERARDREISISKSPSTSLEKRAKRDQTLRTLNLSQC